jgi:hypothetical protein
MGMLTAEPSIARDDYDNDYDDDHHDFHFDHGYLSSSDSGENTKAGGGLLRGRERGRERSKGSDSGRGYGDDGRNNSGSGGVSRHVDVGVDDVEAESDEGDSSSIDEGYHKARSTVLAITQKLSQRLQLL